MMSCKLTNAAATRNCAPILEILNQYLNKDRQGHVLEISCGTGQHVAFMAPHFPNLTFQPTEFDSSMMPSICEYISECPTKNIRQPLKVDVTTPCETWNLGFIKPDYIISINMIHITHFDCTEGLFRNSGQLLKEGGLLITYGPYAHNGVIEPESNSNFHYILTSQNPEWGLRDINDLQKLGALHNLFLSAIHKMPANNKILIWKKE